MKTLTTILIVILTIILGRWLLTFHGIPFEIFMPIYSAVFIGVFAYGVYKILESFDNDNR